MDTEDHRDVLVDRMLSAKTVEKVEEAQRASEEWLRERPDDSRVIAAQQRLDKRREELEDPERTANKATWVALAVAVPLGIAVSVIFSVSWGVAVMIGVLVGMEIASWVWEFVGAAAESRSKRNR